MMEEFKTTLAAGLNILGIEVAPEAVDQLVLYFTELKKWSRKVNLIAKSSTDESILENHFIDSLTLVPMLTGRGKHLLDIGTGAGFPGLVCKIACPELGVTLVEPRLKRVSFLKHVIRSLGLENVWVKPNRIEEEPEVQPGTALTHITARAVSDIGTLLQMVERFSTTGAQLLCMKGPRWEKELAEAAAKIAKSGYSLARREVCFLPFSGAERNLLIFK